MDESSYITEIKKNIDRLISENAMRILETTNGSGNPIFKIQFHPPEWFLELDSDMQYNVQSNLAEYYKEQVKNIIDEMNNENKENSVRVKVKDVSE